MAEKARFKIVVYYPKGAMEETIITKSLTVDEVEGIIKRMTNPTEDVVIEKAPVVVQQQEYFSDRVILKKALLEKDIIIELGVHEKVKL